MVVLGNDNDMLFRTLSSLLKFSSCRFCLRKCSQNKKGLARSCGLLHANAFVHVISVFPCMLCILTVFKPMNFAVSFSSPSCSTCIYPVLYSFSIFPFLALILLCVFDIVALKNPHMLVYGCMNTASFSCGLL